MLNSSRLCLRAIEPADLNTTYLGWLNDSAVNRYLETRFLPQTIEALEAYWQAHRDDPASPWFAICLVGDGSHIGNIKLGPIQWLHRRGDLSLFIGDRSCWVQSFASEAICFARDWGLSELDLNKLTVFIYSNNVESRRVLRTAGTDSRVTSR